MPDKNEEQIRKDLGEKLRECREESGLTQAQVAKQSGVSTNYYARVERGEENLSYAKLHAILTVLNIKTLEIE